MDLTKNLAYDRMTKAILSEVLTENSNAIDIGCHKGEILSIFLNNAPKGEHIAFEPIPVFFEGLKYKFQDIKNVTFYPYALSDKNTITSFQFVKNAPAYSGLKKRNYATNTPDIETINVDVKQLDDVVSTDYKVDLIKIDVEGGEFDVLKGGRRILATNKPILIFEFGLGASDFYDATPEGLFDFLVEYSYEVYTLKGFLKKEKSLSKEKLSQLYNDKLEYYFIAR